MTKTERPAAGRRSFISNKKKVTRAGLLASLRCERHRGALRGRLGAAWPCLTPPGPVLEPQTPRRDPQSAPAVSQGPPARAPQRAARPQAPVAVRMRCQSVSLPGKGQILWGDPAGGPQPSPSPPEGLLSGGWSRAPAPKPPWGGRGDGAQSPARRRSCLGLERGGAELQTDWPDTL